jgi:hypothetical protein
MNENTTGSMAREDLLARVTEGMEVYDTSGDHIGKVDGVYLGAVEDSPVAEGAPSATDVPLPYMAPADVDTFAGMFLDKSEIAKEVRERLRYKGFIRIAPHGLFRTHRYAERNQVVAVGGDRVTLSVPESKLIKG